MICIRTQDDEGTGELGKNIADQLVPPATLLLIGELGAGKTVLARGIFAGLGVDPSLVRSPTFSLVHEYPSPGGTVFHIDLYRLDKPSDFASLPFEEILSQHTVAVVEWADKLPFFVGGSFRIEMQAGEDSHRFWIDPGIPGISEFASALAARESKAGKGQSRLSLF